MAKLTKDQKFTISNALYHARRALRYVNSPNVAIGVIGTDPRNATTTLHFKREDGHHFYQLEKEIGSDLCGLSQAVSILERMLEPPAEETSNEN